MSEAGGQAHFKAMRKLAAEHQVEQVGKEIRSLYSWSEYDELNLVLLKNFELLLNFEQI